MLTPDLDKLEFSVKQLASIGTAENFFYGTGIATDQKNVLVIGGLDLDSLSSYSKTYRYSLGAKTWH